MPQHCPRSRFIIPERSAETSLLLSTAGRDLRVLLFWVGGDKMTFGSDYAIWEPKWQVEGFIDWDYPDSEDFSDYPRLDVNGKKKIMGLNAARLYDIEVPPELQIVDDAASRDDAVLVPESKAEVVG